MGKQKNILTKGNKATALSALASAKEGKVSDCLSSDKMALLVDHSLSEAEREQCLAHLAECQTCYDEWRMVSLETGGKGQIIKGPWFTKRSVILAATGSFLAAAASVLLYINLTPPVPVSHKPPLPKAAKETAQSPVASEQAAIEKKQPAKSMAPAEREPVQAPALVFQQEAKVAKRAESQRQKQAASQKRKMRFFEESELFDDFEMADEAPMDQGVVASASEETMVDIANVILVVIRKMSKLDEGGTLILLNYKRDRSLTLIKLDQHRILIKEKGFAVDEFEVDRDKLKKTLKSLLKKEFPRSNKVRILTVE